MRATRTTLFLSTLLLAGVSVAAAAGELIVSAAASLSNAFRAVAHSYEALHPETTVRLNFAASGILLQQMDQGAPVDVFASADQETMDMAQQKGLVLGTERHDFVRNSLVLIVPADSRLKLSRLADLSQTGVRHIAIANPAIVPVGNYTRHALEAQQLWQVLQAKAIQTNSVRQSLDYVARGEVEAGFVYGTDAALMPDKVKRVFEVALSSPILYPIAGTAHSASAAEARRFVEFIGSPPAQAIFSRYGFLKP